MTISLDAALSRWLINEYKGSAISSKRLMEVIYHLYCTKNFDGLRVTSISKKTPSSREYYRYISRLEDSGVIKSGNTNSSAPISPFYIINTPTKKSTLEMICSIFPYGYISYLSAMSWYGITDRIPKKTYFTSPSRALWTSKSIAEISERIGSKSASKEFTPAFPTSSVYFGKELYVSTTSNFIEPREADGGVRIQDIGDLFIDMLKHPDRCGGEEHVIDVFMEHAFTFRRKIINKVNQNGSAIDKARIGFILQDVLNIDSNVISSWMSEKSNSRGSSRVLSPKRDFSSVYSENWNMSINIERLEKYGKNS